MKAVSVNLIEIILIIVGLAVVALFIIKFGGVASGRTTGVLSIMNALKGGQ